MSVLLPPGVRPGNLRGDSDTLEDGSGGNGHVDISQAEVISALFYWSGAGCLQAGGQEADVCALILGNGLQVGVKGGLETGTLEVALGELVQDLKIEPVLQMLKSESIVEDVGVGDGGSGLTNCKQAV